MADPSLRADCARCAALCCVAFAFDKSDLFAADKAAAEPCRHLTPCGRCAIHRSRAERGYGGCVGYDCQGAGQWVTQVLFAGRSWRDDAALLEPMTVAFITAQRAHAALQLLETARRLPLSKAERRRLAALDAALRAARSSPGQIAALIREARVLLRGLRRHVPAPADGTG
ncbi:MAG: hypothetical protein JSR98_20230 [Proteobacteria bacterium]|nr:hypothetical protein [Pseudomonadota bacterium]